MSQTDKLLRSVKYLVDEHGKQTAVLLDLSVWQQVLQLLEEIDEDENLGHLMMDVAEDDKLEGEEATAIYRNYVADVQS